MLDLLAHSSELVGDKIGLLGMTIDPAHAGHVAIAEGALKSGLFSSIIIYPTGEQNRPDKITHAGPNDRIALFMLTFPKRLFLYPNTKMIVIFADMYGPYTFTIDLFRAYHSRYPDKTFTWITGSDSDITTWKDGDELMNDWNFCIVPRVGYPMRKMKLPKHVDILPIPFRMKVSSSDIRSRIQNRKPIGHLVSHGVHRFIQMWRTYATVNHD